jgi:hypothetical protein
VVEWAVVAAGAVLLGAGFLPWWQVGASVGGPMWGLPRLTAWDGSPAWWVPVLAGAVVGGLWALRRAGWLDPRWLPAVTALVGLVGLGLVVGRWATLPAGGGDFGWYAYAPVSEPPVFRTAPGLGLWLAAAALLVQLAAGVLVLRRGRRPAA